MRASDGQASIEYVAVVALVALVLGGLVAGASAAGDIGRRVSREVTRAVCLIADGDCRRDQEPCVVATDGRRRGSHVKLLILRLGGDETVVLDERSDGTVAVTHVDRDLYGVEASFGVDAGIDVGPVDVAVSAELQAAALARLGEGRTWIVPSAAAAKRLVKALEDDKNPNRRERVERGELPPIVIPPPDVTYDGREVQGSLSALVKGTAIADLAEAGISGSVLRDTGVRVDRRTGRRTVYLAMRGEVATAISGMGGVLGAPGGAGGAGEVYAVELDRDAPVSLSIMSTGRYRDDADLPAVLGPARDRLASPAVEGRAWETTASLDLTVPASLAIALRLIGEVVRPDVVPTSVVAASEALRRRLDEAGTVEARVLARTHDTSGFTLEGGVVAGLGAGIEHEDWSHHLLAAASRGLDGQWLTREDCVEAVTARA